MLCVRFNLQIKCCYTPTCAPPSTYLATGVADGQAQAGQVPQGLLGVRLEEHGQGVDDHLENVLVRVAHT